MFFEILQNSQENTCARVSFIIKPATLLKKRIWHSCFPVNFAKFTEHLRTTASGKKIFVMFFDSKLKKYKIALFHNTQPPEIFYEKVVPTNFTKFIGQDLCLRPANLLKKKLTQHFLCEFCKILKNIFFTDTRASFKRFMGNSFNMLS